jgi:hypothetical protein
MLARPCSFFTSDYQALIRFEIISIFERAFRPAWKSGIAMVLFCVRDQGDSQTWILNPSA